MKGNEAFFVFNLFLCSSLTKDTQHRILLKFSIIYFRCVTDSLAVQNDTELFFLDTKKVKQSQISIACSPTAAVYLCEVIY